MKLDGYDGRKRLQCDNEEIGDSIQMLATIAGIGSRQHTRIIGDNKTATRYVKLFDKKVKSLKGKRVSYDGMVWCPTTTNNTAVFRENGKVFISGNSPFTNITIDWTVPDDLKEQIPTKKQLHLFKDLDDNELLLQEAKKRGVDKLESLTYKHFQKEMNMINRAYYEVMTEGDSSGQPFTFPIPTVNITEDFDWYGENTDILFENTGKIGSSYFQNFIGSQYKKDEQGKLVPNEEAYKPGNVRSMCCRLQLDLRELLKRGGGLFGSAEMTGCYDDKTEILTKDGWILFKNLKGNEKVLSMSKSLKAQWVDIEQTYEYEINDKIHYFSRRGREELVVTSNHRMVCGNRNGDKFSIKRADEIFEKNQEYRIPRNRGVEGEKPQKFKIADRLIPMKDWLRFLGVYLGDGYARVDVRKGQNNKYDVVIAQSIKAKQRKEIEEIVDRLGFNTKKTDRALTIYNKELAFYLKTLGKSNTKHLPSEIFNYDYTLIENVLEGLRLTDYCDDYFYTVSVQLKDDIQKMLVLIGKFVNARVSKPKNTKNIFKDGRVVISKYDLYEICEMKIKQKSFMKKNEIVKDYVGKVYCVKVKHGTVCIRRDGAVNWSGNSIGVVTINMARLGYLYAGNKKNLINRLTKLMEHAYSTLEKKRIFIQEMYDRGLFPYTARYLHGFDNHFSTIGINGMNEMIRNFLNDRFDITHDIGRELALEILDYHILLSLPHSPSVQNMAISLESMSIVLNVIMKL
jgi:hypothetical protein